MTGRRPVTDLDPRKGGSGDTMESEPPSVLPRAQSRPPEPGSAAFRSSSAPTTSVAPPSMSHVSLLWPFVRFALACAMLVLRGAASVNSGATASGALSDVARALGAALVVAALPSLLPRYRSFRAFSWLFLIATFLQLYLSKDRLIG